MTDNQDECEHPTYFQSQAHYGNWQCVHCGKVISRGAHTNLLLTRLEDKDKEITGLKVMAAQDAKVHNAVVADLYAERDKQKPSKMTWWWLGMATMLVVLWTVGQFVPEDSETWNSLF